MMPAEKFTKTCNSVSLLVNKLDYFVCVACNRFSQAFIEILCDK